MIDEEGVNFTECYEKISDVLYNSLDDLDGLAGCIKALIEVADDLNFDKEDVTSLLEKYTSEIYG